MRVERSRFTAIIPDQFLFIGQRGSCAVPAGTLAAQVAVLAHRIPAVSKESVKRVRVCGFMSFALLSVFVTIRK